jgi:hypothetical protein
MIEDPPVSAASVAVGLEDIRPVVLIGDLVTGHKLPLCAFPARTCHPGRMRAIGLNQAPLPVPQGGVMTVSFQWISSMNLT